MVKSNKKEHAEQFFLENYLEKRSAISFAPFGFASGRVARHTSSSMSIAPVLFFVVFYLNLIRALFVVCCQLFVVRDALHGVISFQFSEYY